MDGVDLPQHVPYLADRPLGHLPCRGLVPPHPVLPGQPPHAKAHSPHQRDRPDGQAMPETGYVRCHGAASSSAVS